MRFRWQALHAEVPNMAENQTKTDVQEQPESQEQEESKQEKTFTRDEIGGIVAKQVSERLAEERKKWEQETDEKVQQAKEDGKAEATMSAKELAEKQAKEREAKLDQREKDYEAQLAALDKREHLAHTRDLLSDQGLPTNVAEIVLGPTEEDTKNNIKQYKDLVDQGVRNELHRTSTQKEPQNGGSTTTTAPNKNLADMNYEEMQAYLENNN